MSLNKNTQHCGWVFLLVELRGIELLISARQRASTLAWQALHPQNATGISRPLGCNPSIN